MISESNSLRPVARGAAELRADMVENRADAGDARGRLRDVRVAIGDWVKKLRVAQLEGVFCRRFLTTVRLALLARQDIMCSNWMVDRQQGPIEQTRIL